jgi:hypothetical protein
MCKNGYADGNTKKPESVSGSINYGLTPLFFKIATKIENLSPNRYISPEVCSNIDYFENLNEIRQTFSCDQI